MCEANAYIKAKDEEEYQLFLESVDKILPTDEGLTLQDIFGRKKTVKAVIKEMALVDHQILMEKTE